MGGGPLFLDTDVKFTQTLAAVRSMLGPTYGKNGGRDFLMEPLTSHVDSALHMRARAYLTPFPHDTRRGAVQ